MREYLEIGSSPPEEDPVQVGSIGYSTRARIECNAYRNQLRRVLGEEPEGAQLNDKN